MVAPHYTLPNLENLTAKSAYYQTEISRTNIRQRAVKQAAQALGMQSGLSYESKIIDKVLQANSGQLNQIFRFNALMVRDNVLPPVIEQASNALQIGDDGQTIRIGGKAYTIVKQVRFVTAPPTWRDYLWMDYPEPQLPSPVLLPKNKQERKLWRRNVALGWQQGIMQAVDIYESNLHHLVRDYTGMVLYDKLLSAHMVSPYAVTKHDKGITGDDQHIVIDDQDWHIVSQPQLQIHGKLWQPVSVTQPKQAAQVDEANPQSVSGLLQSSVNQVEQASKAKVSKGDTGK